MSRHAETTIDLCQTDRLEEGSDRIGSVRIGSQVLDLLQSRSTDVPQTGKCVLARAQAQAQAQAEAQRRGDPHALNN
ncbi:GL20981 [Drosophila persimilis]|uniref:GL20981 n=1 Tax=Drosophila persimilis TaxID=7234 RepID=B4H846_DROPE|nr:GL20981 [Drosophila persimilis]